ncbi:MAG TPA: hypothetical protein EYP31_01690, partial [Roseibacterium sp.]|nr:hypothetical protein [Roseibacterium sp.]
MNPALPIVSCVALSATGLHAQTLQDQWCGADGQIVYIDDQGIGWGGHTTCETVPSPPTRAPAFFASLRCYSRYATGETGADGQPEYQSIPNSSASEVMAILLPDDTLAFYLDDGGGS